MGKFNNQIKANLFKPFPQSLLIRKPYWGALIFFLVLFVFVMIYRPLGVHASASFGLDLTMLAYCAIISLFELLAAIILSRTNCFSPKNNWTLGSELLSIILLLVSIGLATYLAGFVLEPASSRWNFSTFFDSFYRAILVGLIPVTLPSLLNIRYAFAEESFQNYEVRESGESGEPLIQIESKAKKERLGFYPKEFIYAESEGNYVVFHLVREGKPARVTVRNSISDIEAQLSFLPHVMRTHRAYLVNLHKITSRKGNALGYRLSLDQCTETVPVSRQHTRKFEEWME